ncbi:MbtH family protein [Streptomyces rubiginosohelvolus]
MASENEDLYQVVVNDEGEYSVWPANNEVLPGYRAEGTTGTRHECMNHIQRVATDPRPLSLRQAADKHGQ